MATNRAWYYNRLVNIMPFDMCNTEVIPMAASTAATRVIAFVNAGTFETMVP